MCLGVSGKLAEVFEEERLFKGRVRGRTLRALRNFTKPSLDEEPTLRVPAEDLPNGDERSSSDEETP